MFKNLFLSTLLFIGIISAQSQVYTNPIFVSQANGSFDIYFNAAAGSAGLKGLTTGVYAHIGVITSKSSSSSDWKYVLTPWPSGSNAQLANTTKNALSYQGNDLWKLSVSPNLQAFLGVPSSESIKQIALVFRNADGTKTGKTSTGSDIFIDVYQTGLNVSFIGLPYSTTVKQGNTLNLKIGASATSTLKLFVNGNLLKSNTDSLTLTTSYHFDSTGDYQFIAEATKDGTTLRDTLWVCVPQSPITETRPAGTLPGINYINDNTVTLVLHAPNKENVFLLSELNDWIQSNEYQLKKDNEYWWITLTNLSPTKVYGFQYLVDENIRISDPYAEMILDPWNDSYIKNTVYPNLKAYPTGKTTGIVATFQIQKPAYAWQNPSLKIDTPSNLTIYEVLLRDFTPEKTIDAALEKLDYLEKLGITAIELMPVTEFDGNESWGYNPNHFFASDKAYGTPNAYKRFVDECHKRGIAVIIDMVFNHATGSCPFAALYWDAQNGKPSITNPWMNTDAPHPYSVFNDFNHNAVPTQEYFKRVLQYWVNEYKVDGFRMDLTKGFTQTRSSESTASNYDQSRIDNLTRYYNAAKELKPDIIFILEHFCSSAEENVLANRGMYLWRNANNAYSHAAMGYSSASGFGNMVYSPRQWIGYAESHDEERNFYKVKTWGNGSLTTDSVSRAKRIPLNIAFATLLPGPKMIWQFEELGYDYSINDLGGRTAAKPSAWSYLNLNHRKEAYEASCKIVNIRKKFPQVFSDGTYTLNIDESDWPIRKIAIAHPDLNLVIIGNFDTYSSTQAGVTFPKATTWYELFSGKQMVTGPQPGTILLNPGELKIFSTQLLDTTKVPVEDKINIFPTLTKGLIRVDSNEPLKTITVRTTDGQKVLENSNSSQVDISTYSAGIYIVEAVGNTKKTVKKVIKM